MSMISYGTRVARAGAEPGVRDECAMATWQGQPGQGDFPPQQRPRLSGPVWPYGLVFIVVVGIGSAAVAIRRLKTPIRRLPNGTRIA